MASECGGDCGCGCGCGGGVVVCARRGCFKVGGMEL